MNNTSEIKPKVFPYQLARLSWIAGVIAIGLIVFTSHTPVRLVGDIASLLIVCAGFLLSIVTLASIPKYGAKKILLPAIVGIMINGLLLAIAIPNFFHARESALERQKGNWKQYQLENLEFLSPIELTKVDTLASLQRAEKQIEMTAQEKAAAEENVKRSESYSGQLANVSVQLDRVTLLAGQTAPIDSLTARISLAMKQQFPQGFQSSSREVTANGIPATRMSLRFQVKGKAARAEYLIILKQPYMWQISTFGPADQSDYSDITEKIFSSVNILQNANAN